MKVLTLSRNYPNNVLPHLGLWVEGLVRHTARLCEQRVVSPVPYAPPLPKFAEKYTRFRRVPSRRQHNGVEVLHPRFLIGPGYTLYNFEARLYEMGVRRIVDRLRAEYAFDLIHAHFSYPDGVVAARLARRYGVPFLITEHAVWHPWMDDFPRVRQQAVWAANQSAFVLAGSRSLRDSIVDFTRLPEKARLVPIGMDEAVFATNGTQPKANQILYVGRFQPVKGVDVLLHAMRLLVDRMPDARLVLLGGSFYQSQDDERIHALVEQLGLAGNVEFAGGKPPEQVAHMMRQSGVVVLPSRRESFGTVLIEALACGTPVVATRCGGPEDIVTDEVGRLVAKEDTGALASAIEKVLVHRDQFDSTRLSAYARERFSWERIAGQVVSLYQEAVENYQRG